MPLLPSHTLLQTYSLTLLLTSYLLLTSPLTLLNATPLWLLGESMHIRPAAFTSTHSPTSRLTSTKTTTPTILPPSTTELLSLLAFTLLLAATTQSILAVPLRYSTATLSRLASKSITQPGSSPSSSLESEDSKSAFAEKLYNLHSTQTIFLTLSAVRVLLEGVLVAYIYLFYSTRSSSTSSSPYSNGPKGNGIISQLANRVVFTVAMADMLFWGYLWTVLREEGREVAGLVGKRRMMEEEREMKS